MALPCSLGCDLCPSYPVGEVSRTLAMCNPEAALLRQEEIFSTTLTQNIINPILKPLLLAGKCRSLWRMGEGTEGCPGDLISSL